MLVPQEIPGLTYSCLRYGDHSLQRIGVWQLTEAEPQATSGYWIIYIHGGAWRDPSITTQSFAPSIRRITTPADDESPIPHAAIRGFASIDYRLSPHDDFPQDPKTTPAAELRSAQHPDHINDVRSALRRLDDEYGLGGKYILIGHSAGATLAFQLLMGTGATEGQQPAPLPEAIIGISGIYDLPGIDKRHDGNYASFLSAAFGNDVGLWHAVSPAGFPQSYASAWDNTRLALLAWSPEDTLVDEPEVDSMAAKLRADGLPGLAVAKDLTGDHNYVWENGGQMRRLVSVALERLTGSS